MTSQKIALFTALGVAGIVAMIWLNSSEVPRNAGGPSHSDISWLTDYDAALALARADGKQIVIDFFATWCGPCKMMEQDTFTDEEVQKRVEDFVALKIDVDQQQDMARRYGVRGLPTTMVIDAEGQPVATAVGYLDPDRFLKLLDRAAKLRHSKEVSGESAPVMGINN